MNKLGHYSCQEYEKSGVIDEIFLFLERIVLLLYRNRVVHFLNQLNFFLGRRVDHIEQLRMSNNEELRSKGSYKLGIRGKERSFVLIVVFPKRSSNLREILEPGLVNCRRAAIERWTKLKQFFSFFMFHLELACWQSISEVMKRDEGIYRIPKHPYFIFLFLPTLSELPELFFQIIRTRT